MNPTCNRPASADTKKTPSKPMPPKNKATVSSMK